MMYSYLCSEHRNPIQEKMSSRLAVMVVSTSHIGFFPLLWGREPVWQDEENSRSVPI